MTAVDDLAEWLTQIWDEREALAKDANVKQDDPVWWVSRVAMSWPQSYTVRSKQDNRPIARVEDVAGDQDSDITGILDGGSVAAHIAANDPASVLARIAADRRILALHAPSGNECRTCCGEPYIEEYWDGETETTEWKRTDLTWPCPTVRLLALPHADRPGYQESWKP